MKAQYERNVVYRSSLSGHFYFAPTVRVMEHGIRVVVGRKYDITRYLEPYLLKRWRRRAQER